MVFDSVSIFDMCAVARDDFKSAVKKADKKRSRQLEKARKYCSDAGYKIEKDKADTEYNESVSRARLRIENEFFDALAVERSKAVEQVQKIEAGRLAKIKLLSDRTMTIDELHALASLDTYTMDYWSSRVLADIAERSGLVLEDLPDIHVLPSLSTKLRVLDEIQSETEEMLTGYNPKEDSPKDFAYLHDAHITKWTERYTNGLRTLASLSDETIIRRAFSKINEGMDERERGKAIKEALDTVPDKCRVALINKIADSHVIGDVALKLSGYEDEIKSFRDNGGTGEYKSALSAVEVVTGASDVMDEKALQTIHDMRGNRFFLSELEKVDTDIARHYAEVAELDKAENEKAG